MRGDPVEVKAGGAKAVRINRRYWLPADRIRSVTTIDRSTTMIVARSAALLLTLEIARRRLEPECPSCSGKNWLPHSTQLQCSGCGWGSSKS